MGRERERNEYIFREKGIFSTTKNVSKLTVNRVRIRVCVYTRRNVNVSRVRYRIVTKTTQIRFARNKTMPFPNSFGRPRSTCVRSSSALVANRSTVSAYGDGRSTPAHGDTARESSINKN